MRLSIHKGRAVQNEGTVAKTFYFLMPIPFLFWKTELKEIKSENEISKIKHNLEYMVFFVERKCGE